MIALLGAVESEGGDAADHVGGGSGVGVGGGGRGRGSGGGGDGGGGGGGAGGGRAGGGGGGGGGRPRPSDLLLEYAPGGDLARALRVKSRASETEAMFYLGCLVRLASPHPYLYLCSALRCSALLDQPLALRLLLCFALLCL